MMDERSVEILTQLKAEVWWPWDRRGGPDGGYNLAPKAPQRSNFDTPMAYQAAWASYKSQQVAYGQAQNINRQRWLALIGELIALNPQSRDVRELRRLYQHGSHYENTKAREALLGEMLK